MTRGVVVLLALGAVLPQASAPPAAYPPARRDDVVEVLHGARVADPYRWLESESAESLAWRKAEARLTDISQVWQRWSPRSRWSK